VTGTPEYHLMQCLFEGLLTIDPALHPRPALPRPGTSRPTGVYTFHLRENLKWSDGSPITTDDVLGSWKRMISPKLASEYAYLIYNFVVGAKDYYDGKETDFSRVGVKAPDERTSSSRSEPDALPRLDHRQPHRVGRAAGQGALQVRKPRRAEHPVDAAGNFVCCGPFMLKEWVPQQRIVAVRNPNYWDAAHVKLDEVDFSRPRTSPPRSGCFGPASSTGPRRSHSKIDTYRRENPDVLHIDPYLGVYFYRCNVTRPPLDDKSASRKALALGIDRESLIRNVTRGGETPAYAVSPPGDAGYTPRARG
jgi:oligopeptide transport system substrate-binding protein